MGKIPSIRYIFTMNKKIRYAGVLLHPTSLPGGHGIGDLGEEAFRFVDTLVKSSVGLWQILPLGPVGFGNSPYAVRSAFAGNELLISLDELADEGFLGIGDVVQHPNWKEGAVDFNAAESYKMPLLRESADRFLSDAPADLLETFRRYCEEEDDWLEDYALYRTMVDHYQDSRWFSAWDEQLARRDAEVMKYWRERKHREIARWKVLQFFFNRQWRKLKSYANEKGLGIVGDIPIFVAHDSVDSWSNRRYLKINEDGSLAASSGVPPDAFSATGQLWGNPVYDWQALEEDGFSWWVRRLEHQFEQTDLVRIDHFRGFEAYWEVPAGHATAEHGTWVKAPGNRLFARLRQQFGFLPVIAEDLGVITPEVDALREEQGFPGMKIAQFAFDMDSLGRLDPSNSYLPHNYPELCVAYTGTHDNDTTRGWYDHLDSGMKDLVRRYLSCSDEQVVWHLMRSIMASCASIAVVPMQDLLTLGNDARMNLPGTCGEPNWAWRLSTAQVSDQMVFSLQALIQPFGRDATLSQLSSLFPR